MFAVIDVAGSQSSYVAGVFRDRKVSKVLKTPGIMPVRHENQPPDQPLKKDPSLPTLLYEQVQAFSQTTTSRLVARDIMASPVVTLSLMASLARAWDLMKNKGFRHIPIQSQDGRLVGIVSHRDLSRATVELALAGMQGSASLETMTIEPYVSHPVLVAALDATVLALARVLLEERIGAIPVISQEKELVGMITRSDLLRVIVSHPNFEQWG